MKPSPLALVSIAFVAALAALPQALAQGKGDKPKEPAPAAGHVERLDALKLTITLPAAFTKLDERDKPHEQVRAHWSALLGKSRLTIVLWAMPKEEFGFAEPEDVQATILENLRKQRDASFGFAHAEVLPGSFGTTQLGALGWGQLRGSDGEKIVASYFMLGGLLETDGYCLDVVAEPALDAAGEAVVLEFLRKGFAYIGPKADPQWTEEEHKARWLEDAPPGIEKDLEKPVRTKH